jgi:hypothetical protein
MARHDRDLGEGGADGERHRWASTPAVPGVLAGRAVAQGRNS